MKLVKLYESVIREGKAQGCLVKFGDELFDPQLSRDDNPEPNTPTEDKYLKLIDQFTTLHHGRAIKPGFVDAMKTLKTCISSYPEVLQPNGIAYRGDIMTMTDLLGQYSDIADDLEKGGIFDFTYQPKSIIQSWTSDKDAAEDFAKVSPFLLQMITSYKQVKNDPKALANFAREISDSLDNITVPIVIKLDSTSDDFLFKSRYFMFLSQHEYEEELLRLSNKPTRVQGEIIDILFPNVFGILRAVKQYEVHKSRQE